MAVVDNSAVFPGLHGGTYNDWITELVFQLCETWLQFSEDAEQVLKNTAVLRMVGVIHHLMMWACDRSAFSCSKTDKCSFRLNEDKV